MPEKQNGGSFSRVRFNAQLGDGPDQRGDVTVEVQSELAEGDPDKVRTEAEDQLEQAADKLKGVLGL